MESVTGWGRAQRHINSERSLRAPPLLVDQVRPIRLRAEPTHSVHRP